MIGMKLLQLGAHANHQILLQQIDRPILQELWRATGETVNLAVLDAGAVVYAAVLESPHEFRLVSMVGMRRPLYSTALGKVLAAFLPPEDKQAVLRSLTFQPSTPNTITNLAQLERELELVRDRGYAVDNEEAVLGARCIAAPVLNSSQEAVAAISIASPSTRLSLDKVPLFAAAVKEAARAVSARMGFSESLWQAPSAAHAASL